MSVGNILQGHTWIDYSSGSRLRTYAGWKLGLLQTTLPIYVTFVGSKVWNIVRMILWHVYWRRDQKGIACHHKAHPASLRACIESRSVIIRNSDGGSSLFIGLIQHWRYWNRFFQARDTSYHVCFPYAALLVCAIHFLGWIAAGIMVNQIWEPYDGSNTQALLTGRCGNVAFLNASSVDEQLSYRSLNNNYTLTADEYARQCYGDDVAPTSSCSYFSQRRITFEEATGTTTCPFLGQGTCLDGIMPYVLDTRYIDSSDTLGINAAIQDRIYFRKQTTCSPVSSRGRVEISNYNETVDRQIWPSDTRLYRFFYGPVGDPQSNDSYVSNWTYEFPSWKPEHNLYYDITSIPYFGAAPYNIWKPNTTFWDFRREDADLALIFVNGGHIVYQYPNNDPVYSTGESFVQSAGGVNSTLWTPEYYTNVLGCIDQYQLCNRNDSERLCTPLVSSYRLASEIFSLALSEVQLETAKRIVRASAALSTHYTVDGRGAAALQASLSVASTTQTKRLSDHEWHFEVWQWFSLGLAKLQQLMVDYAVAPSNPDVLNALTKPENDVAAAQCSSQRISLPVGARNFSWLGFEILIGLGAVLWVVGASAETVVDSILKLCNAEERRLDWHATAPCGLQRLAYRAAGYGNDSTWDREAEAMPVWLPTGPRQPSTLIRKHALHLQPA